MLDIMIFYMDKPVYDNAKKVGEMPHLWLGSYTPLSEYEMKELDSATQNLSEESLKRFKIMVGQIGKRFLASNLLVIQESTDSSAVKQEVGKQLASLYPTKKVTLRTVKEEKDTLKKRLACSFSPEEQVKMMMILKSEHDQKKETNEVSEYEDEIFSRGIAECVQTLRDIPQDQKSPLIRRLCSSATHRQRDARDSVCR